MNLIGQDTQRTWCPLVVTELSLLSLTAKYHLDKEITNFTMGNHESAEKYFTWFQLCLHIHSGDLWKNECEYWIGRISSCKVVFEENIFLKMLTTCQVVLNNVWHIFLPITSSLNISQTMILLRTLESFEGSEHFSDTLAIFWLFLNS